MPSRNPHQECASSSRRVSPLETSLPSPGFWGCWLRLNRRVLLPSAFGGSAFFLLMGLLVLHQQAAVAFTGLLLTFLTIGFLNLVGANLVMILIWVCQRLVGAGHS